MGKRYYIVVTDSELDIVCGEAPGPGVIFFGPYKTAAEAEAVKQLAIRIFLSGATT